MFGLITKRYPEAKQFGIDLKYWLSNPGGILGTILLFMYVLGGFLIPHPYGIFWVLGGGTLYSGVYYLLRAAYIQDLEENIISINPPAQWKIKERITEEK